MNKRLGAELARWRVWLASGLLVLCLASAGEAIYLSSKAWLAQELLSRAWLESESQGEAVKPWPWADVQPRGRLLMPRLGIEQVVLSGHNGEAMAFGPGLAEVNDAVVLAGHRDSHFAFLRQLRAGDRLQWQALGGASRDYQVSGEFLVDTRQQEVIVPPADSLLLITCYPFDALDAGGPLRYVVVAEPVLRL